MIECDKPIYDEMRSGFLREGDFVYWELLSDEMGERCISKNVIEEIDHKRKNAVLKTIWTRKRGTAPARIPKKEHEITRVSFEVFQTPHFNWHKCHEITLTFTLTNRERDMKVADTGPTGLVLETLTEEEIWG